MGWGYLYFGPLLNNRLNYKEILQVDQTTDYGNNHMTVTFFRQSEMELQPHYDHTDKKGQRSHMLAYFITDTHHSNECTKSVKDLIDRIAVVTLKKLCLNCLGSDLAKECNSQNKWLKCNKKHHPSMFGCWYVVELNSTSTFWTQLRRSKYFIWRGCSTFLQTKNLAKNRKVNDIGKETVQLAAFINMSSNVRQLQSATIDIQTDSG